MSSVGVVLTVVHKWSGRLLGQTVIPYEWWFDLERPQREELCMSFFKRPSGQSSSKEGGGGRVEDKDFAKEGPTLLAYLQEDAWPDGQVRQRSTMVCFVEDGMVKGCLSDKDTQMTLWASSRTFWGLVEALEARLTEDVPEWRKSRQKGKKG